MSYNFDFGGKIHTGLTSNQIRTMCYTHKSPQWVRDNLLYIDAHNEANPDKPLPYSQMGMALAESYRANRGTLLAKAAARKSIFASPTGKVRHG
jgi:hypothetical protein